jgi:hypothetical protein
MNMEIKFSEDIDKDTIKYSFQNGYQSYAHKDNSCYITAPLEVLYASYIHHSRFWKKQISKLKDNFGLKTH